MKSPTLFPFFLQQTGNQKLAELASHLAFQPSPTLNLDDYGLVPMISSTPKQALIKIFETTIPLLRNKRFLWSLIFGTENLTSLFIKLGTGGRINHCQLQFTLYQSNQIITTLTLDGTTLLDGQWTALPLPHPLFPGYYQAELLSPDADNQHNTLFLWLTPELIPHLDYPSRNWLDLTQYGLSPLTATTVSAPLNRTIETVQPILQGFIFQWVSEVVTLSPPITTLYLKLGTGGKLNHCHLTLSIFHTHTDHLLPLANAHLAGNQILDNQWTAWSLDQPLPNGQYLFRLHSPDTDDTDNVLFLCLSPTGLENYHYPSYATTCFLSILYNQWQGLNQRFHSQPPLKFSIFIPIPTLSPFVQHYLKTTIDSVLSQTYSHWELFIISSETSPLFDTYLTYPTIQLKLSPPASALNTALALAQGSHCLFLWSGDDLAPEALLECASFLQRSPQDVLYTDEDQLSAQHQHHSPFFKPDWARERLKSQYYWGQLCVYRTAILRELHGFAEHWYIQPNSKVELFQHIGLIREFSYFLQLWDLALRLSAHTDKIGHLPKILYHQRSQLFLFFPHSSAKILIQQALDRENLQGKLLENSNPHSLPLFQYIYSLRFPVQISIIIPSKDRLDLLSPCLESLFSVKDSPKVDWEVIVIDNGSQSEILSHYEKYQKRWGSRFRWEIESSPFNFSRLVNRGVKRALGEIILLLNNDMDLLGPDNWLAIMAGFAQQSVIGCVSAQLLYKEGSLQHTGLVCGIAGIANHVYRHWPAGHSGYFGGLAGINNYSAVTGACLMVKRVLWEQVNGFDENLGVAFNDVDFCLKLRRLGLRNLVVPKVQLYHYESKSRGHEVSIQQKWRLFRETRYMRRRWGKQLEDDPYYNVHLSHYAEDFRLDPRSIYYGKGNLK